MRHFTLLLLGALCAAAGAALGQDDDSFLLRDGLVFTGASEPRQMDILVRDGRIAALGADLAAAGVPVVDASGRWVTPGFMGPLSTLGLVEISLERRSRDDQSDLYSSGLSVASAFNFNSALVPYNRASGLTSAIFAPIASDWDDGKPFAGLASLASLSGAPDSILAADIALVARHTRNRDSRGAVISLLSDALERATWKDDDDGKKRRDLSMTLRQRDLDALVRVAEGDIPLIVHSNREADIRALVALAERHSLRLIVSGAKEAHRLADELARAGVAVIMDPMDNIPNNFDELGARLDAAAILHRAGVRLLFAGPDTHNAHLSRQGAANAWANGLPLDAALAALTSNIADAFGLDDTGRVAEGARADLVIWDGHPLQMLSHPAEVFIAGRKTDMRTREVKLSERYLKRIQQ